MCTCMHALYILLFNFYTYSDEFSHQSNFINIQTFHNKKGDRTQAVFRPSESRLWVYREKSKIFVQHLNLIKNLV